DPRGEGAANAEDLVEHHVGNLVAREPQPGAVRADLVAEQTLTIEHVVQLEADAEAVLPLRLHLTYQDVVVAEPTPIIEADARAVVRLLDHVLSIHALEAAAARQIVADHLRDIEGAGGGIRGGEGHDRD